MPRKANGPAFAAAIAAAEREILRWDGVTSQDDLRRYAAHMAREIVKRVLAAQARQARKGTPDAP
jgi:hypothetical protein